MYNDYSIIIRSKCSLDSSNSSGSSSKSTEEVVVVVVGNFSFCKKKNQCKWTWTCYKNGNGLTH